MRAHGHHAIRKSKLLRSQGEVPPGAETAELEGWEPFAWKHNALRHSFISYRLAAVKNTAQVALEAGNSPQMIFRHYRELVRAVDAEKWFRITAESVERRKQQMAPAAEPENVIRLNGEREESLKAKVEGHEAR